MNVRMTWEEMIADPHLRDLPYKIEQDRYGRVVMSPAGIGHSQYQGAIAGLLRALLPGWTVMVECGVETPEGVKVPDVAAMPRERARKFRERASFPMAPEICVEVLSPRNSPEEMEEKRRLYGEAGAREIWSCSADGAMSFRRGTGEALVRSELCPDFPAVVVLD
jgi:Uma2 family endonuclease